MHEKVIKQKTPYNGNGIPFTLFAFLACPALAYHKFNIGIFNKWATQRECSIGLLRKGHKQVTDLQNSALRSLIHFVQLHNKVS